LKNAIAIMSFSLLLILAIFASGAFNLPRWLPDIVLLAAGMYTYVESFMKYKRFRRVRDTATSQIDSIPMGFVEVYGRAKKFPGMNEIYYYLSHGTSYDWFSNLGFFPKSSLTAKPFLIEDETGKVFVDPLNAEMILNYKTRFDYDTIYRETEIKEGDYVYCLGTVHRKDVVDIADEINKAIKAAKQDKEMMKRFDTNKDGKISEEEWNEARKYIENEVINKNLHKTDIYISTIGRSKEDSIFIISDRSEKELTKRFFIQYVVTLAIGISVTVFVLMRVLMRAL